MPVNDLQADAAPATGITEEDVIACIEMILGRTPDKTLVDYHLDLNFRDRVELGRYMLGTDEFRRLYNGDQADTIGSTDLWAERANAARIRKERLMSFGANAAGLLVETRHGPFVVDPEDSSVSASLLHHGTYAEDELELARSLITPESNVLVVGTHIGGLAIPLAACCRHLAAVEANPATQRLLDHNLLMNRCSNVVLYRAAASDKQETLQFLMNRDNSGGSKRKPTQDQVYYYYDSPAVVEIQAYALDNLIEERIFDLIIMDIEGSEYFALKGMNRILSNASALSMEFLPHHIVEVAGVSIDALIDVVEPHFSWMYVPSRNALFGKKEIRAEIKRMFDQGEGHNNLYFLKDVSEPWLITRGFDARS